MEKYKAQRDNVIREILLYVYEHNDMPQWAYKPDIAKIVKECVDIGYLENIRTVTTLDGNVHFSASQPYVTVKGLATFSHEPNVGQSIATELEEMRNDMRQNHTEEQSEKKKDRRFQLFDTLLGALVGSAFTLVVEHWEAISSFVASLFH